MPIADVSETDELVGNLKNSIEELQTARGQGDRATSLATVLLRDGSSSVDDCRDGDAGTSDSSFAFAYGLTGAMVIGIGKSLKSNVELDLRSGELRKNGRRNPPTGTTVPNCWPSFWNTPARFVTR